MIQSLKMERTQDRRIPFLLTAFLYFITYWFFESISFPEFYLKIFLAATAVVMILSALVFLNIKWSAHLSAMGGIIGMLVVVDQTFNFNITILLIVLILLSGLLASARLVLGAHRIHELAFGFLLGFGAQMLLLI